MLYYFYRYFSYVSNLLTVYFYEMRGDHMQLDALQDGRYCGLRPIGSGGMGEVYLAEDTRIHRQVAIKGIRSEAIIYPDRGNIDDAARLFEQGARAIAFFHHPNI